jgi:RNA-directed DNA polymerase
LRQKLRAKAKQEPKFRFYSLFGHISDERTLREAFEQVIANRDASGVDGVSVGQVGRSEESKAAFVEKIRVELVSRRYRPEAVRRVYIPKPDERQRPLEIPTVRDRVVQTAVMVMMILEPVFEADFLECSHGFRPGRGAHDALNSTLLKCFSCYFQRFLKPPACFSVTIQNSERY